MALLLISEQLLVFSSFWTVCDVELGFENAKPVTILRIWLLQLNYFAPDKNNSNIHIQQLHSKWIIIHLNSALFIQRLFQIEAFLKKKLKKVNYILVEANLKDVYESYCNNI